MRAAYEQFVLAHGAWLAIAGLLLIFGAFGYVQYLGRRARKLKLVGRESLPEDEWFARLYPVKGDQRPIVKVALAAIAQEIGVAWTQLRPTDTFESDLRINRKYGPQEDMEGAALELENFARRLRLDVGDFPAFRGRLSEFLDRLLVVVTTGGAAHTGG
jgi:hypothetical protein